MKYCNTCNNYVDDGYVSCPHCGETYLYIVNQDGTLSHPPEAGMAYAQQGGYDEKQDNVYPQDEQAPVKNKKVNNSKLILIIVAVAVVLLIIILALPTSSESKDKETTAPAVSTSENVEATSEITTVAEETTVEQITIKSDLYKGYLNGSHYVNIFADLSFDITSIPQADESVYSSFEKENAVCGYASVNNESGCSFVFVIEDVYSDHVSYDEEKYLAQVAATIKSRFVTQNISADISESFVYTIADKEYLCMKITIAANGVTEYVCVDIVDNKAVSFVVSALSEDNVKQLLDAVKSGTIIEEVTPEETIPNETTIASDEITTAVEITVAEDTTATDEVSSAAEESLIA